MSTVLTLLSWNIHGCVGSDRRFDLSRVAAVLRELDVDVAALQEVGEVRGRMPGIDQARALAARTGMRVAFMSNVTSGRRRYGNAILSRHPIAAEQHYDLTVGKREPRGCLRADIDFGAGAQLHVFNLHLGLGWRERRRQAWLLSADILHDAALAFPLVVVGDFNHLHPGPVKALLRRALTDGALATGSLEPTFPARFPVFRLDRVLSGEGAVVRAVRVVENEVTRVASDHLPVWVRLEIVPPSLALGAAPPLG